MSPHHIASKQANQCTTFWSPESISLNDKQVALILFNDYFYCPLYIVDVSGVNPKETELITSLTEKLGETSYRSPRFSCDPVQAQVLYLPRTRVGTL